MRESIRRRGSDLLLHVERVWHDRNVVQMVLRDCMVAVWLGLPLGLALNAVASSALIGMVPIESRLTANVYWLVVPIVVAVTSLAAAIPARHAARVAPTVALRCE